VQPLAVRTYTGNARWFLPVSWALIFSLSSDDGAPAHRQCDDPWPAIAGKRDSLRSCPHPAGLASAGPRWTVAARGWETRYRPTVTPNRLHGVFFSLFLVIRYFPEGQRPGRRQNKRSGGRRFHGFGSVSPKAASRAASRCQHAALGADIDGRCRQTSRTGIRRPVAIRKISRARAVCDSRIRLTIPVELVSRIRGNAEERAVRLTHPR